MVPLKGVKLLQLPKWGNRGPPGLPEMKGLDAVYQALMCALPPTPSPAVCVLLQLPQCGSRGLPPGATRNEALGRCLPASHVRPASAEAGRTQNGVLCVTSQTRSLKQLRSVSSFCRSRGTSAHQGTWQ